MSERSLKIDYIRKTGATIHEFMSVNDIVMDKIEWSALKRCQECQAYFEGGYGDGTDDDRFCSDDCQVDYVEEAPDNGER